MAANPVHAPFLTPRSTHWGGAKMEARIVGEDEGNLKCELVKWNVLAPWCMANGEWWIFFAQRQDWKFLNSELGSSLACHGLEKKKEEIN